MAQRPPRDQGARNYAVAGVERPFLAFTVPSPLSASNPRIERDGEVWPLPESAVETLAARSPQFELDDLTVPESVSQGEVFSVDLSVTNVSETDGRFLVALYWPTERVVDDDESHVVERSVPAGGSVSVSVGIDTQYSVTEAGTVSLRVQGHVDAQRNVRVTDVPTDW